jgi:hypothetical protein
MRRRLHRDLGRLLESYPLEQIVAAHQWALTRCTYGLLVTDAIRVYPWIAQASEAIAHYLGATMARKNGQRADEPEPAQPPRFEMHTTITEPIALAGRARRGDNSAAHALATRYRSLSGIAHDVACEIERKHRDT